MNATNRYTLLLRWLLICQLCLLSTSPLTLAQPAPAPAPAATGGSTAPAPADNSEITKLSPFEVVADTNGYQAKSTMSGTRFNSKVEDLATSLTVMTKQQMDDFAMLDLNDMFLYVAGAEGTGTYSDISIDRNGSLSDNVQLNPTQANRIRGISAANISFGNYETMARVPIDPITIDSVEVSRGPNAIVFGLGNPSGTVNQVPSTANLQTNRTFTQFRGDSYDGYRIAADHNQVLIPNQLAVRGSAVFQRDGYVRKPSGTDTVRYNAMVKYRPFKSTTISAAYYYYKMDGNRPNATPPRDGVSYWINSGKPTWDPIAQLIHVNGTTIGNTGVGSTAAITADTQANFAGYFNRTVTGFNRSQMYVGQGGIAYWVVPQSVSSTTLLNANLSINTTGAGTARLASANTDAGVVGGRYTNQPLFTTTPTVNGSVYDWSSINLAAVNRLMDKTQTYTFQVDQFLVDAPMHTLVLQAGWMREDSERYQRNIIGIGNDNGQSGQLLVDVNEKNLDGTPNPFLGMVYLAQDMPRTTQQPATWDTYRAQLAYEFNPGQGNLKWLGTHALSGYYEYKYRVNRYYSFRDAIADSHPWLPAGTPRANNGAIANGGPIASAQITREYFRYYVGDANGTNVDYAPTAITLGTYPLVWGNSSTGVFNHEPAQLGEVATTDATGGSRNTKVIIKSAGGVLQSHFLDGRIVTTFGLRQDNQYLTTGHVPQLLTADGLSFDYPSIGTWLPGWQVQKGKTKQAGAVVHPFQDVRLGSVDTRENNSFLAEALGGLYLTYNKSDSFTPQQPGVTLQQVTVPNPTGDGKDWGFGFDLFGGKLGIRVDRYSTLVKNKSGGDAGTVAQRVTRMDVNPVTPAAFQLFTQATAWVTAVNPSFTAAQVDAEVARQIGLTPELQQSLRDEFNASTLTSSQDVTARGTEIDVDFNPTKFWTVSANGTDTQSINNNVSKDIQAWIDQRMPIWTTIRDQRDNALWWTKNYGGSQTAEQNFATFVTTPFSVIKQLEGKTNPQIRRYAAQVSTSLQLAGLTQHPVLQDFTVGGALRWADKGAIGYYGVQSLPAVITDLDASRPIYDKAQWYVDAFIAYKTRLWADKLRTTIQLNVKNLQEDGRLQPIGAFPDGTPNSYRIVDPRQFILTASFEM